MKIQMKTITLVTGLFNLGRGELPPPFRRPFGTYLKQFQQVLHLDYPMIVHTSDDLAPFVERERGDRATKIVRRSIEELRNFRFYTRLEAIRTDPAWRNQAPWLASSPQAGLELYNPLIMSKLPWLGDAAHGNAFGTDAYVWLDAGLARQFKEPLAYHLDQNFPRRAEAWLDRVFFICFPYGKNEPDVHGFMKLRLDEQAGTVTDYVARATIFGGDATTLEKLVPRYWEELEVGLNAGCLGTEESIFTILAFKYPEFCLKAKVDKTGSIAEFFHGIDDRSRLSRWIARYEPISGSR